jgi:hypothetical protein
VVAGFRWWKQKPGVLLVFLALVGGSGVALGYSVREERRDREELKADSVHMAMRRTNETRLRRWMPFAWALFEATYRDPQSDFAFSSELFAPVLSLGSIGSITRDEFLKELQADRLKSVAERQAVTGVRECLYESAADLVQRQFFCESYSDPPGAQAVGVFLSVLIEGQWIEAKEPPFLVTKWATDRQPLYEAESCNVSISEAQSWFDSLLLCLSKSECPELENFFLPVILSPATRRVRGVFSEGDFPTPGNRVIEELQAGRAAWRELLLCTEAPPAVRRLSGARWELDCVLRQSGTRRSGHREDGRSLKWRIEIVSANGHWKILRLQM